MAWVPGGRDTATFQRLYNKIGRLKNSTFYTGDRDVFAGVLPPDRHVIGKAHTIDIEHDNSNTRHHLKRFTRRAKVVSQKEFMVDLTLCIWHAITTNTDLFLQLQKNSALYI